LSDNYHASAGLARELNRAVVALKKQVYAGGEDMPAEQMAHRRYLVGVLDALLAEIAPVPRPPGQQPNPPVPASVMWRIRQAHRRALARYAEELASTRYRLVRGVQANEKDIELLDELAAIASLDAAETFRRMCTRR